MGKWVMLNTRIYEREGGIDKKAKKKLYSF